jgi:hypothetical protein
MRIATQGTLALLAFMALGMASSAYGQSCNPSAQTCFEITNPERNGNNLAGVYTDPYQGVTGGQYVLPFCDDYVDEVTPNESWNALDTNLTSILGSSSPVQSVYYTGSSGYGFDGLTGSYSQSQDYLAAAMLAFDSLGLGTGTQTPQVQLEQEELSFAIWGIFDPTLLQSVQNTCSVDTNPCPGGDDLTSGELSAAQTYLANALIDVATGTNNQGSSFISASTFQTDVNNGSLDVNIYTPTLNSSTPECEYANCESSGSLNNRPQEFITVVQQTGGNDMGVPEASFWTTSLFDFAGFGLVGLFFSLRRMRTKRA